MKQNLSFQIIYLWKICLLKTCFILLLCVGIQSIISCRHSLPSIDEVSDEFVRTMPNFDSATLPPNIAPLNFEIETMADDYYVRLYSVKGDEYILKGKIIDIPIDVWRNLLTSAKGDTLYTDFYLKIKERWIRFATRKNPVSLEEVDPYISYRLIEPSYVDYETMTICQRDLSNFDESVIYDNTLLSNGDDGQCVNCHSYQDYNRCGKMQFHVRHKLGGTVIVEGDTIKKINLKTDSTLSGGVYPAWHPTMNLIAYSVNETGQVFHTKDLQKVEVLDYASDLILYDISKNRIYAIDSHPNEFETFPSWSPDGKTLYFASAHYEQKGNNIDVELDTAYQALKYNLYCRSFNEKTMRFGRKELVFDASVLDKSAVLPRVSPDGKYLLFSMADYGNFHIWHRSSDLYIKNLKTGVARPLNALNSSQTESYHSWSSNGRWIIFSSRRQDGNYTRLYLSYFDKNGKAHVPFVVPQKNSNYYFQLFKSYNIPEFMVKPVVISQYSFVKAIQENTKNVTFGGSVLNDFMGYPQINIDGKR